MSLTKTDQDWIAAHLVDRRHTDAEKWDGMQAEFGTADLLPMWIADMEFAAPQAVRDALTARVASGVYGYPVTPAAYADAFGQWMQTRHGVTIDADWLRFDAGVVKSLYSMVAWLTAQTDAVMVMQPVYYPFMKAIEDQGRRVVSIDLHHDAAWTIDWSGVEAAFARGDSHVLIFCSPHNPVGRIWTAPEISRLLGLAEQYGITVISDEIHQDFEISGPAFTSALAVATPAQRAHLIVLDAPSKTFNLAALRNSHILIPAAPLRQAYDDYAQAAHPIEGSLLGQVAAMTAYQTGGDWLDHLLRVIRANLATLTATLATAAPKVAISDLQGTYLAFLDIGAYVDAAHVQAVVQEACHLAVDYGAWFSAKTPTFIRLNLATDPALVAEAAKRLATGLTE